MSLMKKYFFDNQHQFRKFNITSLLFSIGLIIFLNKVIDIYFSSYFNKNTYFIFSFILFIISMIGVYFLLYYVKKFLLGMNMTYGYSISKEKERLMPYEFALNNSVDAIYWFTEDAKFEYVNNAACKMLGYRKEELIGNYLELIDPSFTRETAPLVMEEIIDTPNWRLESTQRKKTGEIFDIEVSGHGFYYNGQRYICAFGRDMTQRLIYRNNIISMNKKLQTSLMEKEVLLKEVHHRVKNNMEIISSLLSMQLRRATDQELKYILKQSKSRINTMALVHEFLYLGENIAYINIHDYITRLIQDIQELYLSQNTKLVVDLNIDNHLVFSTTRCIQLGIVLHELCVNSLKYAFKEYKDNLLCIHMIEKSNQIYLKIRDNGDGLENINSLYKTDSIGMQLIHSIVEDQLDGTLAFQNNNGLECNIIFDKKEEA